MIRDMATTAGRPARPRRCDLRRDPANGMVAGVCAGLGKRLQGRPAAAAHRLRGATLASGVGLVAYVLAWILLPAEPAADGSALAVVQAPGAADVEVALGVGFLLLAVLLAFASSAAVSPTS